MTSLQFKFSIGLTDFHISSIERHNGLLLYKWCPSGEADAFDLVSPNNNIRYKIWFSGNQIQDLKTEKKEDGSIESVTVEAPRQALYESGNLMGIFELLDLPENQISSVLSNGVGDQYYENLGKNVVKFIYEDMSRFIKIIRYHFGQYWVPAMTNWDSRLQSLGSYCSGYLNLHWRHRLSNNWHEFMPTNKQLNFSLILPSEEFLQSYFSKDNINEFIRIFEDGYDPTIAEIFMTNSNKDYNSGDINQAFIEACSGLELALDDFFRHKLDGLSIFQKEANGYFSLPLRQKLCISASFLGLTSQDLISSALKAIDTRNKIIHDGFMVHNDNNNRKNLYSLLEVISSLIPELRPKILKSNVGNISCAN